MQDPNVIHAAGGVVARRVPRGPEKIVLVHRPRHRDWSLPKGKLRPGESWKAGALREVLEEVGCEVRIEGLAGAACYAVGPRAKMVLFWHMEAIGPCEFEPSDEVDQIAWLTRQEAMDRLDYFQERRIVAGRFFEA